MSSSRVTRLVPVGAAESPGPTEPDRATRLKQLLAALVDLAAEEISSRPPGRRLDVPLLTPHQAAELLAIPRSTLLDLAARGVLPSLRFGKHVRFNPAELAEAGRRKD